MMNDKNLTLQHMHHVAGDTHQISLAIRQRLMAISQWAALAMLFFVPWRLEWLIALPGLDAASVPNAANVPKLRPADVLAIVSITAYVLAGWPNWRRLFAAKRRVWSWSLIALVAVAALSITWAEHRGLAIAFTLRLMLWVLVALRIACDDLSPRSIALSLLAGLTINAVVGIGQFIAQHHLGLVMFGELPIDPTYPGVSVIGAGDVHLIRLYGLSGHPNVIGGYAAIALLMSIGLIARRGRPINAAIIGAWLIGLMALLLTFSRSAWLAMAIGLCVLALLTVHRRATRPRVRPIAIVLAAIVIAWAVIFGPYLIARISPSRSDIERVSIEERIDQSSLALALIAAHPIGGVGIGNFGVASRHLIDSSAPTDWVHNVPLLIASELGLFGLIAWLIGIGALIRSGIARRSGRDVWRAACGAAIVAMLIVMLFDHYLWTSSQGVYAWAALTGWWMRSSEQ